MTNPELFEDIGRKIVLKVNTDEEVCFMITDCFVCPISNHIIRVDAIFDSENIEVMKRRHNAYFITASNHKLYLDGYIVHLDEHYDPTCNCTVRAGLSFTKELMSDDSEVNKLFNPPNN